MIYRMKQNAAGLASICILSTMVLVMVSMTVSMYAGVDDEFTEENVPKVPAGEVCVYASREYDGKAITLLDHTYPIADTRVYGAGQDNYMASMLEGDYYIVFKITSRSYYRIVGNQI